MSNNIRSVKPVLAIVLTALLLLSAQAFGQSGGSIGGTVMDASQGALVGANVTATNADTGFEARSTTNSSGAYNFPSVPSGVYTVTAEMPGFSKAIMTDVRVRLDPIRLNFSMVVAGTVTGIDVTASAQSMVLEQGASTGTVLQEEILVNLPIITGNVLDLINVMGGVVPASDPLFGAESTTFAGVPASGVNIMRDGISVNEIRYNSGIATPSRMNTEMLGEFKMILSPVDAELGRGAGQIQMTTRSGSNAFHGSAIWNIQNSALDAREWEEKVRGQINSADWRNVNNYILTLNGPIVKNKTFFFVTWDQQLARTRAYYTTNVLTGCARLGIYRYLDGVALSAPGNPPAQFVNRGVAWENAAGDNVTRNLWGISRPAVGIGDRAGEILETYTFPRNTTNYNRALPAGRVATPWDVYANDDGSIELSEKTINNALNFVSAVGNLTPAARSWLSGGISDPNGIADNTFDYGRRYANANSPVYNDCGYDWTGNGNHASLAAGIDLTTSVTTPWDDLYRQGYDKTGFVTRFNSPKYMPAPNNYQVGDGLNAAGYSWTRVASGQDTVFGTVYDSNRKNITTKIDHNLGSMHRLSGTYTYESNIGDDAGNLRRIPDGYGGATDRKPMSFTFSATSTLRPTLLNELRIGLSRTLTHTNNSLDNPKAGSYVHDALMELLSEVQSSWDYKNVVVAAPSAYSSTPNTPYFWGTAYTSTWGGTDKRWTFNDSITWMKGAHSFKGGIEFRDVSSRQDKSGNAGFTALNMVPRIQGGVITGRSPYRTYNEGEAGGPMSGLFGPDAKFTGISEYHSCDRGYGIGCGTTTSYGAYSDVQNLLTYMSGSINSINQYFYTVDPENPRWNNPNDPNEIYRIVELKGRELNFYFKDDWRISNDWTLNLGVRYEYYGLPWVTSGLTAGIKDGVDGMYGVSRNTGAWMPDLQTLKSQGPLNYSANGTEQIFIGPKSPNPDISVFNKDLNNWAPHIGFAWQVPWFGRGKTTLRGGYSISYNQISNYDSNSGFGGNLANAPGMEYGFTFSGNDDFKYIDFSNVGDILPLNRGQKTGETDYIMPLERVPMGAKANPVTGAPAYKDTITADIRAGGVTLYDPNIRNPYVQNVNLSLTRNVGNVLTVDMRYIGTLSRKRITGWSLNTVNYINNGLFDELLKLRAQSADMKSCTEFPFLNSGWIPFKGDTRCNPNSLNISNTPGMYAPLVSGRIVDDLSGAEQLLYSNWNDIAMGNFASIASSLRTANFPTTTTNQDQYGQYWPGGVVPREILPAGFSGGQVLRAGGAPDNLLVANPQYTPTIQRNQGRSNYHSMQVQVSLRPIRGFSFQSTYTWSRSMARGGVMDWSDPNWTMSYGLSGSQRLHQLTTYGSYELPFGSKGFFFRDATGIVKKAIEGWQLSWIGSATSGTPMSVAGGVTESKWSSARWVQVGNFDTKDVAVRWDPATMNTTTPVANYFNRNYQGRPDPQCASPLVSQALTPTGVGTLSGRMRTICESGNGSSVWGLAQFVEVMDDGSVRPIYQNAIPGEIGNVEPNNIYGHGRWSLDGTMAKSIEFMEGKRVEIRVDAQNILNHATPSNEGIFNPSSSYGARYKQVQNPNATIFTGNFAPFSQFNSKAGHRTFQGKITLRF